MVLKRVYLQNAIFYAMILFLAMWHHKLPNNASVLALWFLPLLYLVFLSTQLNHTRNDSLTKKIIQHVVFVCKFILIYLTAGLLEFQSITTALITFGAMILVISITEFILLRGKTQVAQYKGFVQYTMSQVNADPVAVNERTKYQNETNLYIFPLAFMIGGLHSLSIPEFEIRSIILNVFVLALVIYLYRRLQRSNQKTYIRLIERKIYEPNKVKRDYIFAQVMLHLSMVATIIVKLIDGPNSISFLLIIPILMNLKLIQMHRALARDVLTDEEKEIMNID